MTTSIDDLRARRAEWRAYREHLGLAEGTPSDQFARGGLAALAEPLDLRIVVLPADTTATHVVPLDSDTDAWLSEQRPSPHGGRSIEWGQTTYATSYALARASWYRDDQLWSQYIAVHRHGGIEVGDTSVTWEPRGQRAFALRRTVAAIWTALSFQVTPPNDGGSTDHGRSRWPCEKHLARRSGTCRGLGAARRLWPLRRGLPRSIRAPPVGDGSSCSRAVGARRRRQARELVWDNSSTTHSTLG